LGVCLKVERIRSGFHKPKSGLSLIRKDFNVGFIRDNKLDGKVRTGLLFEKGKTGAGKNGVTRCPDA
jgi:hypothetical protein